MKLKDLHNNKTAGFKIPKDYLNNLEDTILNQAKLDSKVKSHGFKTPDGYLDTLEDKIYKKVKAKPNTKVRTLNLKPWIYAASIAASLILLFTLTINTQQTHTISSINNESLESFILTEDLNDSEIATLITDADFFENDILKSAISDASINQYIEREIDLEDFLEN